MKPGRARAAAHDPYGIGAAQAALDERIAARNADIIALAADGIAHAVIAESCAVTRSYVSRLVRDHAQREHEKTWGPAGSSRARRETYADRLERARAEWEAMRAARDAQVMREGGGSDRKEEMRALRGSEKVAARDTVLMRIPTWEEWRRTAASEWGNEATA